MSILTSLPSGDVEFIQNDIEVTIKPIAKRFTAKLKSQAGDKFPEMGTSEGISFFEVPSKDFKEMIKQTIFAVSYDNNRYFMTGVYLVKEAKRNYPYNSLLSHTLGYVGIDNQGLAGIELQ